MVLENISLISEGVKIEGKLNFPGPVKIDGQIVGEITVHEKLTIGRTAKLESVIHARDAIISGCVEGEMHVSGQIEITSTGRVIGNIIQKGMCLIIEKGGLFKGKSITEADEESTVRKKTRHR